MYTSSYVSQQSCQLISITWLMVSDSVLHRRKMTQRPQK